MTERLDKMSEVEKSLEDAVQYLRIEHIKTLVSMWAVLVLCWTIQSLLIVAGYIFITTGMVNIDWLLVITLAIIGGTITFITEFIRRK
jgi:hypothetical protein